MSTFWFHYIVPMIRLHRIDLDCIELYEIIIFMRNDCIGSVRIGLVQEYGKSKSCQNTKLFRGYLDINYFLSIRMYITILLL
jgi:hypothetical protein